MSTQKSWETTLEEQINILGHRNWIVVADAAYPLQSNPGIKTIMSDKGHLETIDIVNGLIAKQAHIRPVIFLDKEMDFISDSAAPGMDEFKASLNENINTSASVKVLHEDIIGMLDEASKLFNVVIIKTDFTIPYTTVFFQLDCNYWNAESEGKLRDAMKNAQ